MRIQHHRGGKYLLFPAGSAAAISASLQPASRSTSAVSAPSSGGGRSASSADVLHVHGLAQGARRPACRAAKFGVKKPTSARCGSRSRSLRQAHGLGGDVEPLEDGEPFGGGARGQRLGQDGVELVDALAALGGVLEPRELGDVGAADLGQDLGPVALACRAARRPSRPWSCRACGWARGRARSRPCRPPRRWRGSGARTG